VLALRCDEDVVSGCERSVTERGEWEDVPGASPRG